MVTSDPRAFLALDLGAATKSVALIGECAELRVLALPAGGVTDAELAGVKKLAYLESLDLSDNPAVTDKAMAIVKELERLELLYLANTAITDKGLFELKPLGGCGR